MLWRDVQGVSDGYRPCAVNDDFTKLVWIDTPERYNGEPKIIKRRVGRWFIQGVYGWNPFNGIGPALERMWLRSCCTGCNERMSHCVCIDQFGPAVIPPTNGVAHLPPSVMPAIMLPICALTGCHKPVLKGEGTKSFHTVECWKKHSGAKNMRNGAYKEPRAGLFPGSKLGPPATLLDWVKPAPPQVTINGDYIDDQENL